MNFNKKQVFSIRKFAVGVCSVALATVLVGTSTSFAEETVEPATPTTEATPAPAAETTPAETPATPAENTTPAVEATQKMEIASAAVNLGTADARVTVDATSGAKFTVDLDGYKFDLVESPKGDGTSTYAVYVPATTKHRAEAAVWPKVTLSYDLNGETDSYTFNEANDANAYVKGIKKITLPKDNTDSYTDEEVEKITKHVDDAFKTYGKPYVMQVDKDNKLVTVTLNFGEGNGLNVRQAVFQASFDRFVVFNTGADTPTTEEKNNVSISNKTIAGQVRVPKGQGAELLVGSENPFKMIYWTTNDKGASYTLVSTALKTPALNTTVTFRVTDMAGSTTDTVVDLTDGGKLVPLHVQIDNYFKSTSFSELTKSYDLTSATDRKELQGILNGIVENSPFKELLVSNVMTGDVTANYVGYNEKLGFYVTFKDAVTLSDGTTVNYSYYIDTADITVKETPTPQPEPTPEVKPEIPEVKQSEETVETSSEQSKPTPKKENTLPKTGSVDNAVVYGVAGAALVASLGLAIRAKKED